MEQQNHNNPKAKTSKNDGLLTADSIHLNDLNRPLFDELIATGIAFYIEDIPCDKSWMVYKSKQVDKTYTIICTSSVANPLQLTHELLHIWMELKGFCHYYDLDKKLSEENSKNYSEIIANHIFNNTKHRDLEMNNDFVEYDNRLAHVKMLVKFESLGFEKSDFLYTKPNFENLEQSYKSKIKDFDTGKVYSLLLDYWSLQLIDKMETLNNKEIKTLRELLQKRSEIWFDFAKKMYTAWIEEFSGIYNVNFYKKLVDEYDWLRQASLNK
jgi:hypothetical protein